MRSQSPIPAELDPAAVTAIVDSREQQPWNLAPVRTISGTLDTGDYAVCGAEHICRIERKSLQDFVACCGVERDRFTRELERMLAFPSRIVIVEASLADLQRGEWRSRILPQSVVGSVASWSAMGISFLLAGDREGAERMAAKILYSVAKKQWLSARRLVASVQAPARLSPNAPPPETIDSFVSVEGAA